MADRSIETVLHPFTAFNFAVEIKPDYKPQPLCSAAFSECDGLEMSMEIKTIREGGNNGVQTQLPGPFSYGQLSLKRGMTTTFDLWHWFNATLNEPHIRAEVTVVMFAADGETEQVRFSLSRCIPVKLKASSLSAKDGQVAIEELQLAYESLRYEVPKSPSG